MHASSGPSIVIRNVRLISIGSAAVGPGPVDIWVRGGVVAGVGPSLAVPAGAEAWDGDGRWAIPGLWDGHVHMRQWALDATRLNLRGTSGPEHVVRIVADHVAALPVDRAAEVITGFGYRSATWPRRPTVAELDAVSGGHPVVLVSGDAHNGWLNSRALALLGVPQRATVLDEAEWFEVFGRLGTLPGADAQVERGYRVVLARAAAAGVVGVTDMEFGPGFREWPERYARGLDLIRVRTSVYPELLDEAVEAGLRTGAPLPGGGDQLTMGPLKIIADGSLNTRTAYCDAPYADAAMLDHPRGKLNYSPAELRRLLARARAHGLEAAVHAIGDAAAGIVLDAFEATGASGSIEHAQLLRWADIPRMARLGVRAGVHPAHLLDDRDVAEQCWPDRTERCFALRAMADAGVVLTMGSDAPVSPLDPWLGMAAAVHRSADERAPWHPEQSLTAGEALAASTDGQGTLVAGSRGDIVLLDDDPLGAGPDPVEAAERLRRMHVGATFVAGRPTHMAL
ncbi:MAG: amidohydrolase family protein [Candidatus Limnocylindrales bacterium]